MNFLVYSLAIVKTPAMTVKVTMVEVTVPPDTCPPETMLGES